MILELDVGNSRIKWRQLSCQAEIIGHGVVLDPGELKLLSKTLPQPKYVRVCCVRKGKVLDSISRWVKAEYGLDVQIARVERICGDVEIHYEDSSRLGVDRWLAMLAAYSRVQGACIIVDGGTALTVDIVAANGQHKGGYILPGLALMAKSLEDNTAIELSRPLITPSISPGHSTEQAVLHGSLATLVALIERVAVAESFTQSLRVIFSGGDAELLAESVNFQSFNESGVGEGLSRIDCEITRDLVMDGLAIACPVAR